MKHAVIVAHPKENSFNLSVARAYVDAVRARGHDVILRDLYRMGFDPCMKAGELPAAEGFGPAPDIQAERKLLSDVQVFAFVYPLWFNAPPAMLKGYLDRVFGMGFGYSAWHGGNEPLLKSRQLISFSSSGAPRDWVAKTGALQAIRALFDDHIAAVCGLQVVDHIHFGDIVSTISQTWVDQALGRVGETVAKYF